MYCPITWMKEIKGEMATFDELYCKNCGRETNHINGECCACQNKKEELAAKQWDKRSVDDRLSELRKRVERLEGGNLDFWFNHISRKEIKDD